MRAGGVWRLVGVAAVLVVAAAGSACRGQGQAKATRSAGAAGSAKATADLEEQDGRLNGAYRERLAQMSGDAAGTAELRRSEREWVQRRDGTCRGDTACLTRLTRERADLLGGQVKASGAKGKAVATIPMELWGTWTVRKVLPAETITCWDNRQARALVGTEIDYHPDWFRWKKVTAENLGSTEVTVSAKQFAEDNSGGGANSSQVSFEQLGIKAPSVRQVTIRHPEVKLPEESMEMPGEAVLLTGPGRMIFSVCNVYFEAARMTD